MIDIPTGPVAWYGAVLATATFGFNLWRAARERPRLQIQIVSTWYEDGGWASVEKTETGGEKRTPIYYFHVEVANLGERPTTLMGVAATTRGSIGGDGSIRGISATGFTVHYGYKFPHVLKPGEVWSCRVKKVQVQEMRTAGKPSLQLSAVHWRDPELIPFPVGDERVITTK